MLNKNVCPKCGQLYDVNLDQCPLCGMPAQPKEETAAGVQRRRLTEDERRQRRAANRRAAADERRQQRDAQRARDAEEERLLEEEEERLRQEKRRRRMERKGFTEEQIRQQEEAREAEAVSPVRPAQSRPLPVRHTGGSNRQIPPGFLVVSILLLLAALAIGGTFLLWKTGRMQSRIYETLSGIASGEVAEPQAQSLTLSDETVSFTAIGQVYQLTAFVEPEELRLPVTYASSNEQVAVVGSTGVVTAVGEGSATVTAACGSLTAECVVTCDAGGQTEPVATELVLDDGLKLDNDDISFFNPGENIYLETNAPAGTEIYWQSSDESVATVDADGRVVAVAPGTATITAQVGEYSATCIVRCSFQADEG